MAFQAVLFAIQSIYVNMNPASSKSFHSKISYPLKYITLPRKFLKKKKLIAFGKTELTNATHGLHILLNTIFQNNNLKYTAASQKISFKFFLLFQILIIFFQTLMHKDVYVTLTSRLKSLSHIVYFEFLLCNLLCSAGYMYQ